MLDFHPTVRRWFEGRFEAVSEPQRLGWPEIRAGNDVLISAPTGSGKTLAAFLISIDQLARKADEGALPDEIEVVYVSPLKALSNDVQKNLQEPLAEMGLPIRVAVRTGDTLAHERASLMRRPAHILVTTPESLYILLTSERQREKLRTVRTVIVDEIHAIADDKRGSHLALTLARLEHLAGRKLQRVGLSATVRPIEEVARFLSDSARIVNVGHRRDLDLAVEVPAKEDLGAVATNELWAEIHERIAELIREHRTTLVFVNTRRLAERITRDLSLILGPGAVLPHHGSLSRELRFEAENRLKNGELRAVVATASLELGIDIGSVDLVIQVGSPRSIATALQRVGRSGHRLGAMPKGRFFATTRDELIECAALVRAIHRGRLDPIEIPKNALDVLAQQIAAMAANDDWREDDLFETVRSAYPYRTLERSVFEEVITMLSEGIVTTRGRGGAYLHRDQVNGIVRGRRGARLAAIMSGGAIPDNTNFQVIAEPEGMSVGTVGEDFAVESMSGDVFLLGTTSWKIRRIEPGRLRVENANGAAPTVPFWLGEAPGRTLELSDELACLREELAGDMRPNALECGLDERGLAQAVLYAQAGAAALSAVPSQDTVVAERFFDEGGGMQLVLHAPFGARVNKAWGLALRKRFCRTFNFELQAAATDNGIVISLSDQHSFPLDAIFAFLHPDSLEHVLTHALLDSPMFASRWRWNASRALQILRFTGGHKVAPPLQRMKSDDLLAAVFPDQVACAENLTGEVRIPDHPLVRETIQNCLHEAMDLDTLTAVIRKMRSGEIRTVARETIEPSPFSHEILNANPYAFLDDAPLEERRARAVQLRRTLDVGSTGAGALDAAAIAQAESEAWPYVRNADELHDALLTLIVLQPVREWEGWFAELATTGRASVRDGLWVATERLDRLVDPVAIVRGWLDSTGPRTESWLANTLHLTAEDVSIAVARLEGEGQILRGKFTPDAEELEWCNRRILARIHRLTIARLRSEIEPVSAAQFAVFLERWQQSAEGLQLHGVEGTLRVIRQMQGREVAAADWEHDVLSARVARYDPGLLDQLCFSGDVMWGRLSEGGTRATRATPVSLFLREDADWLVGPRLEPAGLSHPAKDVLAAIRSRGALFFNDLTRLTGRLASEVEDGLWELIAAGLVTGDGFENLRALVDPKRRRGEGRGRLARPRHAAGRWALLEAGEGKDRAEKWAVQLLQRWGVVFRDLLTDEALAPPWRDLVPVYRQLELRGEVRGGRFVSGFGGEQFALPEAVEALRVVRREPLAQPA